MNLLMKQCIVHVLRFFVYLLCHIETIVLCFMSWLLGDKNDNGGGGWNTTPAENIALGESLLDLQALRYSDLSGVTVRRWSLALSMFFVMVIIN